MRNMWKRVLALALAAMMLSGCAQTRETSSTIFAMNTVMELTAWTEMLRGGPEIPFPWRGGAPRMRRG